MNRTSIVIAIAVMALTFVVPVVTTAQVPPGQVGYWPLDENGGSIAHDFQAGQNGTLAYYPTWTPGKFGACLSFDMVDDFVQLPPGMLSSNAGSVAMWFKTPASLWTGNANYGHMFWAAETNSGDGGGGQHELHLYCREGPNHGRIRFFIEADAGTDVNYQTPSSPVYDDDVWHHAVATWDKTANTVTIYIDGAQRVTGAHTGVVFTCNGVARLGFAWSGARYYGGLLDDVRLFNRALNATEVSQLFAVTPTAPRGTVRRTLPSPLIFDGAPLTVQLTAVPLPGGGQIVVTETIPGGVTPTNINPSAGTAPFSGGAITWTVTLGSVGETLTYQLIPTGGPSYVFPGTYAPMPSASVPIEGDNTLYGGAAVGQFVWHGNIGTAPLGAAGGNPSLPGSASFAANRYTISGAGADVAGQNDRCHLTAKKMSGNFAADATISWVNAGTNLWSKAGLMIRRRVPGSAARAWAGIRNPLNVPGREAMFEWRTDDAVNAANNGEASWPNGVVSPVKVRLVRIGDTISSYYYHTTSTAWVLLNPPTQVPALTETDVDLSLFVTSHQDISDGGTSPTGTILATANFDNFAVQSVTPVISAAVRDIQASVFHPGQPVNVSITLTRIANTTSVVVTETVPTSWTVSNVGQGGTTVSANVIRWTVAPFNANVVRTYTVTPIDQSMPGLFSGQAADPFPLVYPITGETMALSAYKRIIYIRNLNAGDYPTHDRNIINALGDVGVRVGSVTVPPLRYQVIEVQQDADADNYSSIDGDLLFVSQTVGSANTKRHGDDAIPIVMTEQAHFDDSNQLDDLWFSNASTAYDENTFLITSTTHPITSMFPLGNLTIYSRTAAQGQIGVMRNGFGTGIMPLATRPTSSGEVCLAVFERGATGLYFGGGTAAPVPTGYQPAPRRRACLGYHQYSMTTPTVAGVQLLQRVIQWTMEDTVNVSLAAPATPSGLQATPAGATSAQLQWNDVANESGYRLERRVGATGPWLEVAVVAAGTTQHQDSGYPPGSEVYYRIRAYNPAGNSPYSNEAPVAGVLKVRQWEGYR